MNEFLYSFIVKCLGPFAFSCLLLMIALTIVAIATAQIVLMIPAMILGVVALFNIRWDV